jgi:uncharacterized protein YndB with AHSA1/START domain
MNSREDPIVVEQDFDRSAPDVWNAITDIKEMRNWYFEDIPDFKAEPGFCSRFSVEAGDRTFVHIWHVTEVIPQREVIYSWKYEGFPGESSLSFEVSGDEHSAHLLVTAAIIKPFPDNIPEFKRQAGVEGWTYFIKDRLKNYLDAR